MRVGRPRQRRGARPREMNFFKVAHKYALRQGCHTPKDAEFYAESNGTLYIAIRPGIVKKKAKNVKNVKNVGRTLVENHAPSGGAALPLPHEGNHKVLVFFK